MALLSEINFRAIGRFTSSLEYISILFLISGFSALIYQVVWQRVLFSTFGVNAESVTVVVSVFMFGLGVGALAGGWIQKTLPRHLLMIFLTLEVTIGLFGLISLDLIRMAGTDAPASVVSLVLNVYALLLLPTLMMGATLPVLVALLQPYFHNMGRTVGMLYAMNTLGSAIAAFVTVYLLFAYMGLQATVYVAAASNFLTACLIYFAARRQRAVTVMVEQPKPVAPVDTPPVRGIPYGWVWFSTAAIGFVSLSQEILWYRLLGFMTGMKPQIFGYLLASFLFGIAAGAWQAKRACEKGEIYPFLFRSILWTGCLFYAAFPLIGLASGVLLNSHILLVACVAIAATAFVSGGIFPLLVHVGIRNDSPNAPQQVANLYFANILGSTLGPLITGFVLLEYLSLDLNIALMALVPFVILVGLYRVMPYCVANPRTWGVIAATALVGIAILHPRLYDGYLEKTFYANSSMPPFKHVVENRSGIIIVEAGGPGHSDTIFGNGAYDGRFNTDISLNDNGIDRAYMIASLHRAPRRALEIGLSSGSWARVMSQYAPLEHLISIEINRGYLDLVGRYPAISPILDHPKVRIRTDDGRRWLKNHPTEKFDFMLMNTSQHWRSNSTNLLSVDFFRLAKAHLNPGGVIYLNATGSEDVVFTLAHAFQHVIQYRNFVAASDAPFDMTDAERRKNLLRFVAPDGTAIFSHDGPYRDWLEVLSTWPLRNIADQARLRRDLILITDDNMATEYKTLPVTQ